ncbi:ribonuclease P protein component [Arhodomonas sp. SL1]|uniref:ribonuclease P protein component n=1 Tax=Arhodomonas sp. SL1 TaxID=3425691 RepID=UPI003F8823B0
MASGAAGGGSRFAFPRSARLTDSRAFSRVFADAVRVADSRFTLLYRRQEWPCGARLGLAVSRRTAPRAADRNRIKRIIRECFRHQRHRMPPVDIVVIARPPARTAGRRDLAAACERLLERVQRSCAPS